MIHFTEGEEHQCTPTGHGKKKAGGEDAVLENFQDFPPIIINYSASFFDIYRHRAMIVWSWIIISAHYPLLSSFSCLLKDRQFTEGG